MGMTVHVEYIGGSATACVSLDTSTSILVFVCGLCQLAQIHLHVAIDAFLSVGVLIEGFI